MKTTVAPIRTTTIYSIDNETFTLTSMSALLQALVTAGKLHDGVHYYAAEGMPSYLHTFFDPKDILERADDMAYDEVGAAYDNDFQKVSDSARDELNQLLKAWTEKHLDKDYWRIVSESSMHSLTAEEIEEYQGNLDTVNGALSHE